MGIFLLFIFVLAGQLIGGFNMMELPPSEYGNIVTILSIDGGGIKGIIPTIVLHHLEKALKERDENATIAEYFDVIAGTSTGGFITTMLATPHPNHTNRPVATPNQILHFFTQYGPHIFNQTRGWSSKYPGPKFDGKFLHNIERKVLGNARLSQTLTNVVIPTFDIKTLHPVIFSSFKVKENPSLDAKLCDIALGTSAAPTLLPPYYFENHGTHFNLVDGALAANNPALIAVNEVIRQYKEKNANFIPLMQNNNNNVNNKRIPKIMVLSIGTGTSKSEGYSAKVADNWSEAFWEGSGILANAYDSASKDMTEYYLSSVFPGLQSSDNYLRIQEYNLDTSMNSLDNATKANMDNLVKVGKKLLKEQVKKMNVDTFVPEIKPNLGTNALALDRLAEILHEEKQLRLRKKSMDKKELNLNL